MKKLPAGVSSFQGIRQNGFVYVDKTSVMKRLIEQYPYVYLARPKHFGKTLLVDTFQSLFEGRREFFGGLKIEGQYDWSKKHPVLRFDLLGHFESVKSLKAFMMTLLERNQKRLGLSGCEHSMPTIFFRKLIDAACEKYESGVVILVDNYDRPIVDNAKDIELSEKMRRFLNGFFGVTKDLGRSLRFMFLAGTERFSSGTAFSGLNYLVEVGSDAPYYTLCGYTKKELETNFAEHLEGTDWSGLEGYDFGQEELVYRPYDLFSLLGVG